MNIKKHIPNAITCGNLLCGCIGILSTIEGMPHMGAWMIFAAAVLDFFDGFIARLLHVSSPIGKELDSLADVVSFGVLPGFIMYSIINTVHPAGGLQLQHTVGLLPGEELFFIAKLFTLPSIAFLIPVFSALRLAKFNIDTRQSDSFIGVPTPANAILIASIPLMFIYPVHWINLSFLYEIFSNEYVLMSICVIMSFLLVSEIPLIALKFKDFSWENNKIRYLFLISSVILIAALQFTAVPFVIILYVLFSLIAPKK